MNTVSLKIRWTSRNYRHQSGSRSHSHSSFLTLLAVSVATAAVAPPPEIVDECNFSFLEIDVDVSDITVLTSGAGDQELTSSVCKDSTEVLLPFTYSRTGVFNKKELHPPYHVFLFSGSFIYLFWYGICHTNWANLIT